MTNNFNTLGYKEKGVLKIATHIQSIFIYIKHYAQ